MVHLRTRKHTLLILDTIDATVLILPFFQFSGCAIYSAYELFTLRGRSIVLQSYGK